MRPLLCLLIAFAPTLVSAQTKPMPRDPAVTAEGGTGVIKGRVVAADTGKPLRRARVSVAGIGLGRNAQKSTSTGLDGSYVVRDLPAAGGQVHGVEILITNRVTEINGQVVDDNNAPVGEATVPLVRELTRPACDPARPAGALAIEGASRR